jgi:hypothetical protein
VGDILLGVFDEEGAFVETPYMQVKSPRPSIFDFLLF